MAGSNGCVSKRKIVPLFSETFFYGVAIYSLFSHFGWHIEDKSPKAIPVRYPITPTHYRFNLVSNSETTFKVQHPPNIDGIAFGFNCLPLLSLF